MRLDDIAISRAIVKKYSDKLLDSMESDVIIVGGGPAGLAAAYYSAGRNRKVIVLERKLSIGGGMWGGGIMFNEIVVQEGGKEILDEFGIATTGYEGYYCADSIETVSTLCSKACKAGARILNLLSMEDVMLIDGRVTGLVINWTAVEMGGLHVDPITFRTKYVVDASGHAAEVATIIQKKSGCPLLTETGKIMGEKPMHADVGERMISENTKEFFPGVFAAGMCCNAIFGAPRMGPIFGGMLMSGKKVAELIDDRLKAEQ